jgi:hypothetical protein
LTRNHLEELESRGLLLVSDSRLPSLAAMVAGSPIHGSWWAHPASQKIFAALTELSSHPDVLVVKLIAGKNTLLHRRVWPDLVAIAVAGEPWQFAGLSQAARRLLERVNREGQVEATGALTLELETRLLVRGDQFHRESGEHHKRLEDWKRWAASAQVSFSHIDVQDAKVILQSLSPEAQFPWPRPKAR